MLTQSDQKSFECILHNSSVVNPRFFSATTTTKIARELLKQEMIFNWGKAYRFKSKSLGLGVYEMTLVAK